MGIGRAVVVNGPRQSGKTSLLRLVHAEVGGDLLSLDEATALRAARTDPGGFVRESQRPTFIDEIQRGGDPLLLAIKAAVDRSNERGQFVLAGSTRFLFEPRLSESLAGRALFVDLWPFSQGELEGVHDDVASVLFAGPDAITAARPVPLSRTEVFIRVLQGGMPEAVALDPDDRGELLRAYVRTIVSRDIPELGRLPTSVDLGAVARLMAARTGQELNIAGLASDLGASVDVIRRVLAMLETVYFFIRLPAWSRNLSSKVIRKPKLYVVDSAIAGVLNGTDPQRLQRPGDVLSGALLETFVVGELIRQRTWSAVEAEVFHWRDRDGAEVDVVLERPSGEVIGLEVKAAHDVDRHDTRGLRLLRDRLGDAFRIGVVLHCGDRIQRLEDRIYAAPVSLLWAPPVT